MRVKFWQQDAAKWPRTTGFLQSRYGSAAENGQEAPRDFAVHNDDDIYLINTTNFSLAKYNKSINLSWRGFMQYEELLHCDNVEYVGSILLMFTSRRGMKQHRSSFPTCLGRTGLE